MLAINDQPSVVLTDDGLYIDGSILWLDARCAQELTFISSAMIGCPQQGAKVIATPETLKILKLFGKSAQALACGYDRVISIGKLQVELLPSGSVLGGASLWVKTPDKSFLYAPDLLLDDINTTMKARFKQADCLILNAKHPISKQHIPQRSKEKAKLLVKVQSLLSDKTPPIIVCKALSTAQEVVRFLSDNGVQVYVHKKIARINRIYENAGCIIGSFKTWHPKVKIELDRPLIIPAPELRRSKLKVPGGPVIYIEDSLMQSPHPRSLLEKSCLHVYLTSCTEMKDLKRIVAAVKPQEVLFFGPYAKSYAEQVRSAGLICQALFKNNQPPMF